MIIRLLPFIILLPFQLTAQSFTSNAVEYNSLHHHDSFLEWTDHLIELEKDRIIITRYSDQAQGRNVWKITDRESFEYHSGSQEIFHVQSLSRDFSEMGNFQFIYNTKGKLRTIIHIKAPSISHIFQDSPMVTVKYFIN